MNTNRIIAALMMLVLVSCGSDDKEDLNYNQLLKDGISKFTGAKYSSALSSFKEAESKAQESKAEINSWIGWTQFKLNNQEKALEAFDLVLADEDTLIIDAIAGTAFTLNSTKEYDSSNDFVNDVYDNDDNWSFAYGLDLSVNHLILLKAQNYFNLGYFSNSINEVKKLDGNFSANVSTADGQAALANKIEQLIGEI